MYPTHDSPLLSPRAAVLALATSTPWCSVALRFGDADGRLVCLERSERVEQQHSNRALVMARELLDEAGLGLSALDVIAFDAGPGSFTGIRIGCGLSQGLGFATGKPLVAVSSLEALAWQSGARKALVAIDARMQQVYTGTFCVREARVQAQGAFRVEEPAAAAAWLTSHLRSDVALTEWIAIGDGFDHYPALADAIRDHGLSILTVRFARAAAVAAIASYR
ncbi:MAG: tRNA (adenosine(37)-N6)-threonylcarbamoyltransferase complex dimerization subunit type 1 TsaB, partial [Quisquiliibacterium sp.]